MWPFKSFCKSCANLRVTVDLKKDLVLLEELVVHGQEKIERLEALLEAKYISLSEGYPPTSTNILVASKDFTYFGFLYFEDGWDNSRKINMHSKDKVWATYTNTESITWWLNLDAIKKGDYDKDIS